MKITGEFLATLMGRGNLLMAKLLQAMDAIYYPGTMGYH